MAPLLYLDTARLGRMSPGARRAHHAFTDLAGEEGGSAYYERLLGGGVTTLPPELHGRYAGLSGWGGVGHLKRSLRQLTGTRTDLPVLLANRSAQLMKLTARILFHTCRNVLTTDLDWPGYRDILLRECGRANGAVTTFPAREVSSAAGVAEDELVARVCDEFKRRGCDGLFLTAVSSDGIRLPVARIVREVEAARHVWFVGVDGAQEFCHAGADPRSCDLYLTGAHKWLGAYHPLGIGFYGRRRSRGRIETLLAHMTAAEDIDDPLLRFSGHLEAGTVAGLAETVSVAPLLSCQGAVDDWQRSETADTGERLAGRLTTLASTAELASGRFWRPVLPNPAFRSGILMLRPSGEAKGPVPLSAASVRNGFRERGVSLSAYDGGVVRLSIPSDPWSPDERGVIQEALHAVAAGAHNGI